VFQVAACHCRVHETYKRCFPGAAPLLPCKVTRLEEVVKPCRCVLFIRFASIVLLFFMANVIKYISFDCLSHVMINSSQCATVASY
jgi:hypothetical protein